MSTVITTTQGNYVVVESLDEIKDLQGPLIEFTTLGPDGEEIRLVLNSSFIVSASNLDDFSSDTSEAPPREIL